MHEIETLIARATASRCADKEKQRAFGEIVREFQDLAFGCAYAVLGDFQLAEDAAQEAFVVAWRNLNQLRQPQAFPGWFKRIVLSQCNRLTRGKQVDTISLETAQFVPSFLPEPQAALEQAEQKARVQLAIASLPPNARMVITLFYINDYSQNEIAAFLELPLTTVKKRLFCARKLLREKMLDFVRDTLQEKRPSRDAHFANTVALYNEALESFVNKIKQDRYVIAAILFGSLAYDKVWEKSDIDMVLIGRNERVPVKEFNLIENGINIHVVLVARSKFKHLLEGSLQSSFTHSWFSKSTLLYTTDDTIHDLYQEPVRVGQRDIEMQLLAQAHGVLYTLAKAEKWFHVKQDLTYSFLWIMYCVNNLATIEVIQRGEVTTREVIHQALKHNPAVFNALYFDLIHGKKDEAVIEAALGKINAYLDERLHTLFKPILSYLADQGGVRSTTDIDAYFTKQTQIHSLATVYEWLADKGILQKVPCPVRLTEKSQISVDEAGYYYDAEK